MLFAHNITSHYRNITSKNDIAFLIKTLIADFDTKYIELGFFDKQSYDFYFNAYLDSIPLLENEDISVGIHLPRKDRESIWIDRILDGVCTLNKNNNVVRLIVHSNEYIKYKSRLASLNIPLYVENPNFESLHLFESNIENEKICCDVSHFYSNDIFMVEAFHDFIRRHKNAIWEMHFSYKNHELLDEEGLVWFAIVANIIETELNKNIICVFEWTNKKVKNMQELVLSLLNNTKLFKSIY